MIKSKSFIGTISFILVVILMIMLLLMDGYAPFGNNSLAAMDGDIQYVDFFGYLKNVIDGNDSLKYSLNSTLGSTGIALLGYYMNSPLNILFAFGSKADIHSIFDIIVVLKLAISAFIFSYYLQVRFDNKIRKIYVILLSISYALMQYNIAQSSNIMWLDGVYMLPLILLGIYKLIKEEKINLLSISVGVSILFNWYSAGANCLFSILWFVVEFLLNNIENKNDIYKKFAKSFIKYIAVMVMGVMLSAILFFPNILKLMDGKGGGFDWNTLSKSFTGNIISTIHSYTLGATSNSEVLSIYCGTVPLIGCIAYFLSKIENKNKKIILAVILIISIMTCYWKPLFFAFSLLKAANSYWFRYSYIIIFTFIFIAANYYKRIDEEREYKNIIYISFAFSGILLVLNYVKTTFSNNIIYCTIIFNIIISFLVYILMKLSKTEKKICLYNKISKDNIKRIVVVLLVCVCCIELVINAKILIKTYHVSTVKEYKEYCVNEHRLIDNIKEKDVSNYRISKTVYRDNYNNYPKSTANYNEALNYNYMSNTGYTSIPDNKQLVFLDKLGYKSEGENITIANNSILGADSLLGIKYILSPYDIKGLIKREDLENINNKNIYENPYALPLAFKYSNVTDNIEYTNPFEYQNKLYSILVKKEVEIYKKISYSKEIDENGTKVKYHLDIPSGEYSLYGNFPINGYKDGNINVNGVYNFKYFDWLSDSVFYIPTKEKDNFIEIVSQDNIDILDEQIYLLDLNLLKEVTEEIQEKAAKELKLNNDKILIKVDGNNNEKLLLTVGNSKGWIAKINGNKVIIDDFADCLMSIPLIEGENVIELEYNIPGLIAGMFISVFGIILLIAYNVIDIIKHKNKKYNF